jgi:hypothetical protein
MYCLYVFLNRFSPFELCLYLIRLKSVIVILYPKRFELMIRSYAVVL